MMAARHGVRTTAPADNMRSHFDAVVMRLPLNLSPRSEDAKKVRDPLTEVGVTPKCLRRLQLLSGGWIRLYPASVMSTARREPLNLDDSEIEVSVGRGNTAVGLLCRAIAVTAVTDWCGNDGHCESTQLSDDKVLVPPSVSFNAGLSPFSAHAILRRADSVGSRGAGNTARRGTVLHRPPPIARSASVSRVKTPRTAEGYCGGSSGGSTWKQARAHALALMAFFSTPRVLHVGDVFGVSVPRPRSGGSIGGDGVGCWWQGLQEEDGGGSDADSEDGVGDEVLDSESVAQERTPWRTGSLGTNSALSTPGEGHVPTVSNAGSCREGELETKVDQPVNWEPAHRRRTAGHRFREAIVRQGARIVFYRVTDLEEETSGGGGGSIVGTTRNGLSSSGENRGERGRRGGDEGWRGAAVGMVVSRCSTELREGGPVCSAVPDAAWYERFVCRLQGYPCPTPRPPIVSVDCSIETSVEFWSVFF